VNPPGGEIAAAQYLKRLFDHYHIPNEIIEPEPGRASFIAHLGVGEKDSSIYPIQMSSRHRKVGIFRLFPEKSRMALYTAAEQSIVRVWQPLRLVRSSIWHKQRN